MFAKEYGLLFGLIFQIIDDLIDEKGSFKSIGKTPGKDNKQGKSTLLSILGEEKTTSFCRNKIHNFKIRHTKNLKNNELLIDLLNFGIRRVI